MNLTDDEFRQTEFAGKAPEAKMVICLKSNHLLIKYNGEWIEWRDWKIGRNFNKNGRNRRVNP